MSAPSPPPEEAPLLLTGEDRLSLLSTLFELALQAARLAAPDRPASDFLQRLAERLGCVAVVWLETPAASGQARLLGSAGIARASLALPLPGRTAAGPDGPSLPYPELSPPGLVRWTFSLQPGPGSAPQALILAFRGEPRLAHQLRRMVEQQLLGVLQVALGYRQAYARLVEQATLLQCESEAADEGILILAPDGRVASVNRRFREMWGLAGLGAGAPAEDWVPRVVRQVREPGLLHALLRELPASRDAEHHGELSLRDGRTLEVYSSPVRSPAGAYFGRGWYFRDVTAERRAHEERDQLLRQERAARLATEEALRQRDVFLSLASHELKTPLTALVLRLAGLERAAQGTDLEDLIHKTQASLAKLTRLVNYLLDSSRVSTGQLELHREPCSLNRVVREVVGNFRDASAAHRLRLDEAGALTVFGDPLRLEQVVTNLVDNAIKYSPLGGEVRVALAPRGKEALLSVSDPGVGIPRDQQPLLFRRFFRAENVRNDRFSGLGLGLYICRDIVERHGGHIWVDSEPGHGTTFYVALPALGEARPGADGPAPAPPP